MDEKVIVNLGFFLFPSTALTIPSSALTTPSPALIIPFPPVNKYLINSLLKYQVIYLKIQLFVL